MAGLRNNSFSKLMDGSLGYIVYAGAGVFIAFLLNQGLAVALDTNYPIVAVVSSSMTHDGTTEARHYQFLEKNFNYTREQIDSWPVKDGFPIGDLPIVVGSKNYNVGDVVVYLIPGQKVPIIHRIVKQNADGSFMTKGDHNPDFLSFEKSVKQSQVQGKVAFIIPKLGYFKVILSEIFGGIV